MRRRDVSAAFWLLAVLGVAMCFCLKILESERVVVRGRKFSRSLGSRE